MLRARRVPNAILIRIDSLRHPVNGDDEYKQMDEYWFKRGDALEMRLVPKTVRYTYLNIGDTTK